MFYNKQQMYLGNKSQLLKIFDPIDIVCDSYFDNSLKLHTLEPKDFQTNSLRHKRNKVTLNLILVGKLLTHDFVGGFVFISMSSKVKCNSSDVSEEDVTFIWQIKGYLVECMSHT